MKYIYIYIIYEYGRIIYYCYCIVIGIDNNWDSIYYCNYDR